MAAPAPLSLEDVVVAVYCALDDALLHAGIHAKNGKLVPRFGPAPEVDDREILCLAVLQELLGFESDNEYHLWLNNSPTIQVLFPRRLSRQNFADRRALPIPILERLNTAFCDTAGEGDTPFASSIPIPSTAAVRSGRCATRTNASPVWQRKGTVPL